MAVKSSRGVVIPALMTAVLCVVGPIAIPVPFTPVPLSVTNLIVFLMGYIVPWRSCVASYGVYILIGLLGVPVFSAGGAGLDKVLGPTGGYLIGLLFASGLCALVNYKSDQPVGKSVFIMITGLVLQYGFGTLWFMYQQRVDAWAAVLLCVAPFLIGDGIKVGCAAMTGPKLRKLQICD